MKRWGMFAAGLLLVPAGGCRTPPIATFPAEVTSEPSEAVLITNGRYAGLTPLRIDLPQVSQSNVVNVLVAIQHRRAFGIRILSGQTDGTQDSTNRLCAIHFDLPPEAELSGINWSGDADVLFCIPVPSLTRFTSAPPGATLIIDNVVVGVTPCSARIPSLNKDRDAVHTVVAMKEGFDPQVRLFGKRYIDDRLYSLIPADMHFDLKSSGRNAQDKANQASEVTARKLAEPQR